MMPNPQAIAQIQVMVTVHGLNEFLIGADHYIAAKHNVSTQPQQLDDHI